MREIQIPVLPLEIRDQLRGFNEKVRRLEDTRYFKSMATAISFERSPTRILAMKRKLDEDEQEVVELHLQTTTDNLKIHNFDLDNIEAFVLTYRMLTQNNDRYSIANLAKSYDQMHGFFRRWIEHLRSENQAFLTADSSFCPEHKAISNQELLEVVIYGQLAHSNKEKQAAFKHWTRWPTHENILWFSFDHIVRASMEILQHFRDINAAALMVYFRENLDDEQIFRRLKEKEILRSDAVFPIVADA
ncbi:hypothetical protein J2S30_005262 [Herbaspirillum rubrisubalbicans]|uniref:hypothetical protein n=1 Tax=Herbaspirillum rubrisubalbicans TaxID=80842 RepID=UPI0020A12DB3|nr:hypothetical protein [Herbaspirillum rubrisubalbicans]MCP1576883.1 hypothetical protein [Herbaspirillum rubrisubalbicans]